MRWALLCTLLLVTAFVVIYRTTTDIWTATNGAGIIAIIFLIGAAIRLMRIFGRRRQKIASVLISTLLICGLVTHWVIMWKMTEWQFAKLMSIRRIIYNGSAMSALKTPALDTFREFRLSPPGRTIGGVFRQINPGGSPVVDSVLEAEMGPVFTSVKDSVVQLTEEARFVPGFDPAFVNYDGRHGLAQIEIRVTPEGAYYEVQN